MINILFNSDYPELAFSISTFVANLNKEDYPDELCCIIPTKTINLNKDLSKIKESLDDQIEIITGGRYFENLNEEKGKVVKYALFGIYPANEEEEKKIAKFFDRHSENILLWLDWHQWPENLLSFLNRSENFLHNEIMTCLELLGNNNYQVPSEWLKTEMAMIVNDLDNNWAARYWKTFLLSKSAGYNTFSEEGSDFIIFSNFISEILNDEINEGLNQIEEMFVLMEDEADDLKNKWVDDHPIFIKAKQIGRPVGCLFLDNVEDYFNAQEIIEDGSKQFPWLCILRYYIDGLAYISICSDKIDAQEIINNYEFCVDEEESLYKILNEEILRFQESN